MNLLDIERPKWQGPDPLAPGKHTIVFDWKMEPKDPPLSRGGAGTLSINGKQVAQKSLPRTQPLVWAWDETFDIGLDTGTPVDDKDYQVPFAFTGKLGKITFDCVIGVLRRPAGRSLGLFNPTAKQAAWSWRSFLGETDYG